MMVGNPNHGSDGKFSSGNNDRKIKALRAKANDPSVTSHESRAFHAKADELSRRQNSSGHNAGGGNREVADHIKNQHAQTITLHDGTLFRRSDETMRAIKEAGDRHKARMHSKAKKLK